MPDRDRPSSILKTLTKGAGKESRGATSSRKNFSASLEAIKEEGGEEASSNLMYALEMRNVDYAHKEKMSRMETEERKWKLLVYMFFGVLGAFIVFLAVVIIVMPIVVKGYNQNMAIVPSILFIIGNLMGYVFGRGIK